MVLGGVGHIIILLVIFIETWITPSYKIFPWLINKGPHSPLEVYSSIFPVFQKPSFKLQNVILNSPWYPVAVSRAYMKNTKISILRIVLVFLRLKEIFLHSLWSLFKTDNILITTTLWTTKEIQQHLLDQMTLNLCRDNISFEPYLREYNKKINNIPFNWPKKNAKKRFVRVKRTILSTF